LNAVHLTGDLKIVEAVPVLAELLRDPLTKGGATNFGMALRLGDDPPGRALADIGEPATEAVGALLVDQDRFKRWRAALVLGNINSAHADQLLELRLSHEDDPAVRAQIQSLLGERRKAKAP
jgi:HEAT repeat protein